VVFDIGEYYVAKRVFDRLAEAELPFAVADHEVDVTTIGPGRPQQFFRCAQIDEAARSGRVIGIHHREQDRAAPRAARLVGRLIEPAADAGVVNQLCRLVRQSSPQEQARLSATGARQLGIQPLAGRLQELREKERLEIAGFVTKAAAQGVAGDMKRYRRWSLVHVVVESDDFAGAENVLDLGAGWSAVRVKVKPRILVPHPAQAVAGELDPITRDPREADLKGLSLG